MQLVMTMTERIRSIGNVEFSLWYQMQKTLSTQSTETEEIKNTKTNAFIINSQAKEKIKLDIKNKKSRQPIPGVKDVEMFNLLDAWKLFKK